MKLTVLVDNYTLIDQYYVGEPGVCYYIENDNDKIPEIAKFLKLLKKLDIKKVDIYGKGNKEEELKQLVKSLRLGKVVNFKGYVENLNEHIDNYTGTIGLGRVSMESLCMNYPSILAGYGKVIGVIDKETFDEVKGLNFVPSELEEKTEAEIISQIDHLGITGSTAAEKDHSRS